MFFDINHLKNSKINFIPHLTRVLKIAFTLIFLGIAGIIHAVIPFIFTKTVSRGIKRLYDQVKNI